MPGDPRRTALAVEAHRGWPERGGGARVLRARAQLARALWSASGERRLPTGVELDRALMALPPSELTWVCELSPLAPLYLLPTRPFVHALARTIVEVGARRVVEVAAGDGFLARCLRHAAPALQVIATDSGAWRMPEARMNAGERRALAHLPVPGLRLGSDVQKLGARLAAHQLAPDLVLCAWLPPGHLLDQLIRAPVDYVLEIGAGSGVTASAYSWRFQHEFLEGPLARHARCRLDARPTRTLHSRATLYFGARHPEHFEERVRPDDWLWQFKPKRRNAGDPDLRAGAPGERAVTVRAAQRVGARGREMRNR